VLNKKSLNSYEYLILTLDEECVWHVLALNPFIFHDKHEEEVVEEDNDSFSDKN
jgi:hypothetical protein